MICRHCGQEADPEREASRQAESELRTASEVAFAEYMRATAAAEAIFEREIWPAQERLNSARRAAEQAYTAATGAARDRLSEGGIT